MKAKLKSLSTFIITSIIFLSLNANAQTVLKGALRIAIGADGLLPVGNLKSTVNFGLGITPDLQYGLTEHLALTFTTVFYRFSTKKLYINDGLSAGYENFSKQDHSADLPGLRVTYGLGR